MLSDSGTCEIDIAGNLATYLGDRKPTARYASFDYCFNHFQQHRAELGSLALLEMSCLHLGFYLASWGMYRGSPDLLQRSLKHLEPLIDAIASADPRVWAIDANGYTDGSIEVILHTARVLRLALGRASDTLVTKIMLGVFGCVPAFDVNVKAALGVTTFGKKALTKVRDFYSENAEIIEANRVLTLELATGAETSLRYTRAKVIDMVFFIEGMKGRIPTQDPQAPAGASPLS